MATMDSPGSSLTIIRALQNEVLRGLCPSILCAGHGDAAWQGEESRVVTARFRGWRLTGTPWGSPSSDRSWKMGGGSGSGVESALG